MYAATEADPAPQAETNTADTATENEIENVRIVLDCQE
jgi:hypothetical protein